MQFSIQGCPKRAQDISDKSHLLAHILFGSSTPESRKDITIAAGLPLLGGANSECWFSETATAESRCDDVHYVYARDMLFGHASVDSEDHVESATNDVYARIFSTIADAGFPHLARIWHYLPEIHIEENSRTHYELFCAGRSAAYQAHSEDSAERYCAATVIGTQSKRHIVYFIATPTANVAVENILQTNPWEYPDSVQKAKPLFTRATWSPSLSALFISGTASIVGHSSRNIGNAPAQVDQIFQNFKALLQGFQKQTDIALPPHFNQLKVYLKSVAETDLISDAIEKCLREHAWRSEMTVLLEGDICRPELAVEIEGVIGL